MKFVYVKIPAMVEHHDSITQDLEKTEHGTLLIRMFVGDNLTTEDVLERLAEALGDKLSLVDLGDDE